LVSAVYHAIRSGTTSVLRVVGPQVGLEDRDLNAEVPADIDGGVAAGAIELVIHAGGIFALGWDCNPNCNPSRELISVGVRRSPRHCL
jgi:hypothetical protein